MPKILGDLCDVQSDSLMCELLYVAAMQAMLKPSRNFVFQCKPKTGTSVVFAATTMTKASPENTRVEENLAMGSSVADMQWDK